MNVSSHELLNAQILIVEDEPAHVQLLERILHGAGYAHVSSTTDPRQVCTMHRANRYDLILLNLHMPGTDGFRVIDELNAENDGSYLPVVVLTAQPEHKQRALEAGAKDFISKPFDMVEVRTRLRNMLEVRLLHRKLANYTRDLELAVRERTAELLASEERYRRFAELAADWYWEQNEGGEFTQVSGPAQEMLGLGMTAFLGRSGENEVLGWDEDERRVLHDKIAARQPFLDFPFSRGNGNGSTRYFRVSGEPMFNGNGRYVGFRGIGAEVAAKT